MNYAYTIFGAKNTYSDWHLTLKTQTVENPEVEASMDETVLYGQADDQKDVRYSRRQMTFEYTAWDAAQFPAVFDAITSYLHGRKLPIVRSVEPDYTYIGRCRVDPYRSNRGSGTIVITVDAEPYKIGPYVTETISGATGKTITVDSAHIVPAIVTVTPQQDIAQLTLTGLSRDKVKWNAEAIVIRNMTAGQSVILDGERELFTEDGANKYPDMEIWNAPTLIPGNNIIGVSTQYCTVEIKYRPRLV